jgi:colicin import membrane protein
MHVRAIAFALPLVAGIACGTTHSRSDGSAPATGQAGQTDSSASPSPEPRTAQSNTAPAPQDPSATGTAATGQAGQAGGNMTTSEPRTSSENTASSPSGASTGEPATARSGLPPGGQTTSEPRTANEPPATASSGNDTTGSAGMGRSGSASGSASAGGSGSQDPIIEQGDPVKAHAEDSVVSGHIARISRRTVVIESEAGAQKSLVLVPETTIQVDGQDAHRSDLKEGQEVRASFSEVNGREIAVKVRAGKDTATKASPDDAEHAPTRGMNPGSSSQLDSGAGSSSSTGSTSSPSDSSPSAPAPSTR